MFRKTLWIVTTTMLIALPGAAAFAAENRANNTAISDDEMVPIVSQGTISKVDHERGLFVLIMEKTLKVFVVTDNTEYRIDGESATMQQALRPGAQAAVTHKTSKAMIVAVQTQ